MPKDTHTVALRVTTDELKALQRFKESREFDTMSAALRDLLPLQQLTAVLGRE